MSNAETIDKGFRLTGRHVLMMLIAFFAVVFAVNAYMMRVAVATFSGVESATPYKNGLAYNTEIAGARRQAALGWTVDAHVGRGEEGRASVAVDARDQGGMGVANVLVRATLERPAEKRADRSAEMRALGAGRYAAELEDVAAGQWDLVIEMTRGEQRLFKSRSRIVLR